MASKIFTIALAIVGISLTGCASSGRQFSTTHVNDIQIGGQDKQTIMDWFGQPNQN